MSSSVLAPYIVSLLFGYCIGSFPTAYVLVKWMGRIDIRRVGTGNVGARNTYDVTGSKSLGFTVLVVDLLKGVLAVCIPWTIFGREFWVVAAGGIGAVLGHNYSVWINFKGGRGLATAAGVMLVLGWVIVVAWALVWFIVDKVVRNLHVSNVIATIVSPFAMLVVLWKPMQSAMLIPTDTGNVFVFSAFVCLLILLRHVEPIVALWNSYTKSSL